MVHPGAPSCSQGLESRGRTWRECEDFLFLSLFKAKHSPSSTFSLHCLLTRRQGGKGSRKMLLWVRLPRAEREGRGHLSCLKMTEKRGERWVSWELRQGDAAPLERELPVLWSHNTSRTTWLQSQSHRQRQRSSCSPRSPAFPAACRNYIQAGDLFQRSPRSTQVTECPGMAALPAPPRSPWERAVLLQQGILPGTSTPCTISGKREQCCWLCSWAGCRSQL